MLKRKEVKKYGKKLKKGFKKISKDYKKYAPVVKRGVQKANKFFEGVGKTASESLIPNPNRKKYFDLTKPRKGRKIRTKRGIYLDLT